RRKLRAAARVLGPMIRRILAVVAGAAFVGACAQGGDGDGLGVYGTLGDAGALGDRYAAPDVLGPSQEGGSSLPSGAEASAPSPDAGPGPSTADAASSSSSGGLSPQLDLPDPGGSPCADIGTGSDCPSGELCRIDSTTTGRCEGCTGACAGPGDACT